MDDLWSDDEVEEQPVRRVVKRAPVAPPSSSSSEESSSEEEESSSAAESSSSDDSDVKQASPPKEEEDDFQDDLDVQEEEPVKKAKSKKIKSKKIKESKRIKSKKVKKSRNSVSDYPVPDNRDRRVTTVTQMDSDAELFTSPDGDKMLLYLVFCIGALASMDMPITLPSLDVWLSQDTAGNGGGGDDDDLDRYGFVIAAFNVGQILFAPLLSYWHDKRTIKEVMLLAAVLGATGNFLFYFTDPEEWLLLAICRFLAGAGASIVFVAYGFLTKQSSVQDAMREKRLHRFGWTVNIAAVIAPCLGVLGCLISVNDTDLEIMDKPYPCLFMGVSYSVMFLVLCYYVYKTPNYGSSAYTFGTHAGSMRVREEDFGTMQMNSTSLLKSKEAMVLLCMHFSVLFAYWMFITSSFPMTLAFFNWGLEEQYLYFAVLSAAFLGTAVLIGTATRYNVSSEQLASICLMLGAFGGVTLLPDSQEDLEQWQVYVAGIFFSMAFCVATVVIPKSFALLTGFDVDDVALRMSWFFMLSSLAAGLGPVVGSTVVGSTHVQVLGVVSTSVLLLATIVHILIPPSSPDDVAKQQKQKDDRKGPGELRKGLLDHQYL